MLAKAVRLYFSTPKMQPVLNTATVPRDFNIWMNAMERCT